MRLRTFRYVATPHPSRWINLDHKRGAAVITMFANYRAQLSPTCRHTLAKREITCQLPYTVSAVLPAVVDTTWPRPESAVGADAFGGTGVGGLRRR
jgi:hypothetical protein